MSVSTAFKSRRKFIKNSLLSSGLVATLPTDALTFYDELKNEAVVISTWVHGMEANALAYLILEKGGYALDAIEAGLNLVESDPLNHSVGYGGWPDALGKVTLDACIMREDSQCGSVAFLQDFKNPLSIARKVMEETPHVMLVGEGAKQFAIQQGFKMASLLTPESLASFEKWKLKSQRVNVENHDTISALALDRNGKLCGGCTTSGIANKIHGRVGDSPIIGAGLFLDGKVGGACATGHGEEVIRNAGSAIIVELMRQGKSPQEACEELVERVMDKYKKNLDDIQIGFLALNLDGETGAACIHKGFNYALTNSKAHKLIDAVALKP